MNTFEKKDQGDASLSKAYEAQLYEKNVYRQWEQSGYFDPDRLPKRFQNGKSRRRRMFSMVMPPPNTTGKLHLGHASAIAYEDLMVRLKRLQGFKTLYLPGTDHAAIGTQNKVERLLASEGSSRQKLGREKFLERVRLFVAQSQGEMKEQIRRSGASCDWSREAYTFDDVSSRVVNEVFISMYEDGLIYRGDRIVNWCTRCNSTLADDEVEYVERVTPFYYLKYGPVVIGTARPETKFLDKVIVVHPADKRYQNLIGKEFDVPWIEDTVKARVIADKVVDSKLGTGAMTITPAHSFEDFELAQKNNIDVVQIIDTDGKLTEAAGSMKGLPVEQARALVVKKLKDKGLIKKVDETYIHNLSVCYRCGTPIEPLVSKQWFVDVNKRVTNKHKSLKQLASDLVRQREIEIIPERFRKVYFHWLDNLHDWCISRQLWWGHRIPVWYCSCGEVTVSVERPKEPCKKCGTVSFTQDEDTLDTWFSSATWTFSTLLDRDHSRYSSLEQWIKHSKDLRTYHPTSVLETGYDIIFFWVARMVLVTSYIMEEKPFDHVYLHGMVRDKQGRKMSKSLGNGIDPNEMIDRYGADALRLSLIIGSAPGQDVRLYDEKVAGYRNFINKLWNISRFIFNTVDIVRVPIKRPRPRTLADHWILNQLDNATHQVTQNLDRWQFSLAGEALYKFSWQELADWYLEITKVESVESATSKDNSDAILLYVLHQLLILWHPFAPFVTEVLWKEFKAADMLLIAEWPSSRKHLPRKPMLLKQFTILQDLITTIRMVRAENKISASTRLPISVEGWSKVSSHQSVIEKLALCTLQERQVAGKVVRGKGFMLYADVHVDMTDKKREQLRAFVKRLELKLSNKDFIARAPSSVIDAERQKLKEAREKLGLK